MSPKGVYTRGTAKPPANPKPGTPEAAERSRRISEGRRRGSPSTNLSKTGVKVTLMLSDEEHARVARGALADERTVAVFLRRFIIGNMAILDPTGEIEAEDAEG